MARLVRMVCRTCEQPVRYKRPSSKEYAHVADKPYVPHSNVSGPPPLPDHVITIKMVTLIESF
jgi:hypothetical protein